MLNTDDYARIEKAIEYISENFRARPGLEEMAAHVHLSKFHFERLFKRWAGVTPLQFMRYLTLEYTKTLLDQAQSLDQVSHEAGLSGSGRLHDLFVTLEAVTPGQYKRQGAGLEIAYGLHASPFGECLLAVTGRGVCFLAFTGHCSRTEAVAQLAETWPLARLTEAPDAVAPVVERIFNPAGHSGRPFTLHLKGTNFQVRVWKALLGIPEGSVASYQDVADTIGRPKACRAVANAVAANPVSYLIPCHRVINKSGHMHKYRWGSLRKKAMLGWEAARTGRP